MTDKKNKSQERVEIYFPDDCIILFKMSIFQQQQNVSHAEKWKCAYTRNKWSQ